MNGKSLFTIIAFIISGIIAYGFYTMYLRIDHRNQILKSSGIIVKGIVSEKKGFGKSTRIKCSFNYNNYFYYCKASINKFELVNDYTILVGDTVDILIDKRNANNCEVQLANLLK